MDLADNFLNVTKIEESHNGGPSIKNPILQYDNYLVQI